MSLDRFFIIASVRRATMGSMNTTPDTYTHGHHESVLRSHTSRTAENSAGYLLPYLGEGMALLDVGCGPGTITLDLAELVAPGEVVAIDAVSSVLEQADALRRRKGIDNCSFQPGDVYHLGFEDGRFDVVHAHQLLQHLSDPVGALREMHRVLKPNGVLAARDADYSSMTWAPDEPLLDRWLELYHQVTDRNGAEADAGRYLLGWAQQAGFTAITASSSTWTFATPSRRAWWGSVWAERVLHSSLATQAIDYELSDQAELEAISDAWERWAAHDDGFFAVVHGEIIASK